MGNWTFLSHVTPTVNIASIIELGILPSRSQGKREVVWLCGKENLIWAVAHISAHHHVAVDALSVVSVEVDFDALKLTRWHGVYTADFEVHYITAFRATDQVDVYARVHRLPVLEK